MHLFLRARAVIKFALQVKRTLKKQQMVSSEHFLNFQLVRIPCLLVVLLQVV